MALDHYEGSNGSWEDANFESGTKPVDGGSLMVPNTVGVKINGTDQNGINLAYLEFQGGYLFDVGASGNELKLDADKILHAGSGTLYFKSDGAATNVGTTDWVIIDSDNPVNAAELDGDEITRVSVKKGTVTLKPSLGDSVKPAIIDVLYRDNPASDAHVIINCDMLTNVGILRQTGGVCDLKGSVYPAVVCMGGVLNIENEGATAGATIIGGTTFTNYGLIIGGSGVVVMKTDGRVTRALIGRGGTLDARATGRAVDIVVADVMPGGTLVYNPDTYLNVSGINDLGGAIIKQQAQPASPFIRR